MRVSLADDGILHKTARFYGCTLEKWRQIGRCLLQQSSPLRGYGAYSEPNRETNTRDYHPDNSVANHRLNFLQRRRRGYARSRLLSKSTPVPLIAPPAKWGAPRSFPRLDVSLLKSDEVSIRHKQTSSANTAVRGTAAWFLKSFNSVSYSKFTTKQRKLHRTS